MHPAASTRNDAQLDEIATVLAEANVAALTGAGISTDSGIPDYRGPGSPPRAPMTFQEFLTPHGRQRYWARSFVGWQRMSGAVPNAGHRAVAHLGANGLLAGLITQNVDGLHQRAGSTDVIDLHGRIDQVICLRCARPSSRLGYQTLLAGLNPGLSRDLQGGVEAAPDGDAVIDDTASFVVGDCEYCGGVLKPDVVFFGESVPPATVRAATDLVDSAAALLVLGSSLTVYSGRRFARQAAQRGIPILVINRGPTRADELATIRIEGSITGVLTDLAAKLAGSAA